MRRCHARTRRSTCSVRWNRARVRSSRSGLAWPPQLFCRTADLDAKRGRMRPQLRPHAHVLPGLPLSPSRARQDVRAGTQARAVTLVRHARVCHGACRERGQLIDAAAQSTSNRQIDPESEPNPFSFYRVGKMYVRPCAMPNPVRPSWQSDSTEEALRGFS